ncbi:SDR family oxidoreductase [Niveibacterium microcysteis]|uniref:SDR family oxidoreductase n=1 Tax=Niveibacterium microcysteis TaxID=2811415 RepID=A0ABX7M5Z3_9RHOO|nr:SDR family oxidoreductase [Niveibacterium microcysteis]QSI77160.1 SDR family oxidoreductase [Niveibacterium microcysteis]
MIVVTGASGQLGRLVINSLLARKVPAAQIVAAVRNPARAADLAALGVQVRAADYTQPATLDAAFNGADQVLLVSSSEVGQRFPQHKNVIDAAKRVGVKLLAYTSLLHADSSPLGLRDEHFATEQYLLEVGLPHVVLRNGWYTENYLASIPPAVQHGAYIGSAGEGRIASAARADYADAAAVVLTSPDQAGKVYELAGDESYTLAEFAAELSRQTGKQIPYINMAEAEFKGALLGAGLPEPIAALLADSDTGASKGGLFDDSHTLSTLIGRPTASLAALMQAALK